MEMKRERELIISLAHLTVTSEPSAHDARSFFCLGRRDTMIHNNMTTFNFSTFSNQVLARKMEKSTFIRLDQRR